MGNLFGTPDRKDRKYGAGGKLLEDPDCFYHYDDEGNLIFREFKRLQETGVRYDRKRMEKERGIVVWQRKRDGSTSGLPMVCLGGSCVRTEDRWNSGMMHWDAYRQAVFRKNYTLGVGRKRTYT